MRSFLRIPFALLLTLGVGGAPSAAHGAASDSAWWAKALAAIRRDQEKSPKPHPSWTSSGEDAPGATFGAVVAAAGDVNGDGYDDVIVGAPLFSGAGLESGKVYVFFGSPHGLSPEPGWSAAGSGQTFAQFGASVATAGDVNSDGFADIVVGEPYFGDPGGVVGKIYVFHGSPSGPSATPDWTSTGDDQDGAQFCFSVSTAGDVNGDGFSDVIVGAPLFMDSARRHVGKAYVFHGSAAGLPPAPNWQQTGEVVTGIPLFGQSVSTAGDVNGDGFSEIIVGAPFSNSIDHFQAGKIYVFRGGPLGLTLMPVWYTNGDDQEDALFGHAVAAAGDVNGDGFGDVVIGAHLFSDFPVDTPFNEVGKAYVYLGSASGLSTNPGWTSVGDDQGNARFGSSVASAGDVNGDGFDEILVGAPLYSTSAPTDVPNQAGKAYLFLGSRSGPSAAADWTSVGDDQTQAFFGLSVAGAGDVNGDGLDDVLVGAPFFNTQNPHAGKAYLFEGRGAPRHRHHRRRHSR